MAILLVILMLLVPSKLRAEASASQPAADPGRELPRRIDFTVKDFESKELRFIGDEVISFDGPLVTKVTTYQKPGNGSAETPAIAQRETVIYHGQSLDTVSYRLDNFLTGETAEVTTLPAVPGRPAAYSMRYLPAKNEKEKTGMLLKSDLLRSGKVLHHVIVRNWEAIRSGKPAAFDLLVPFKMESFRFQVAMLDKPGVESANSSASESAKGSPTTVGLRLQPDSWLIRKFVQSMDFFYAHGKGQRQRLVRYEGPTTIDAYRNPDWKVSIEFTEQ